MNAQIDLSLAGLDMRVYGEEPVSVEDRFCPFLSRTERPEVTIRLQQAQQLLLAPGAPLWQEQTYRAYCDGKGRFHRDFLDPLGPPEPYAAATYDYPSGEIQIEYLPREVGTFHRLQGIFHHVGIESLMLYRDRLCFHAACIRIDQGGLLFSGPSGIGKSTQAELWCRHRGAKLINGDRPILNRGQAGWVAWGSPYAGSSHCYVNESCSINAIVMLRQGKSCILRRLTPGEAFRAIWSGVTVPGWDTGATEKACDLALEISMMVPVYELTCTPEEQAVALLERELRKDGVL